MLEVDVELAIRAGVFTILGVSNVAYVEAPRSTRELLDAFLNCFPARLT